MEHTPVEPTISVRLITADYYMSSPIPGLDIGYSIYRGSEIKKVPVIRVFGTTPNGCKVCLHVHGVFPYFYVPYDGSSPPDQMGHQIAMALDKAINVLQGQGTSSTHHVFKAVLVSGIPIYGYHAKEHQLFKIYFYNPTTRKHSYDLLLNGAVLKKILQPCEAHIPFILQFLMDFNLQGMNFIHLKKALARRQTSGTSLASSTAEPTSTCEMELDCFAGDILNSLDVQGEIQMNPGLAALWDEEIERRKMKNMNLDNIHPPASQPRLDVQPTSSHEFYIGSLRQRLRECAIETGDLSMTFCEVNEQMETSLAIETPEGAEKNLLSASAIDFHLPTKGKDRAPQPSEDESELLDILCDLADDHGSFISSPSSTSKGDSEDRIPGSQNSRSSRMTVTTPILDFVSSCDTPEVDLPFDDDSILGTQRSRVSPDDRGDTGEPNSDSDDERETLEMTQIFEEPDEHLPDVLESRKEQKSNNLFTTSTSLLQIVEEDEDGESSSSSFTETYLPNVDGADDDSSDEEKHASYSGAAKQSRTYKPLRFRSSLIKNKVHVGADTLQLQSPAVSPFKRSSASFESTKRMPEVNDSLQMINKTRFEHNETHKSSAVAKRSSLPVRNFDEDTDALYAMSYLSPISTGRPESPPRPITPIKNAQVTLRPLLQDIRKYETTSGRKLAVNSGQVILKSLEEEVSSYETRTQSKLRLPSNVSIERLVKTRRSRKRLRITESDSDQEENKKNAESQITKCVELETTDPTENQSTVAIHPAEVEEMFDLETVHGNDVQIEMIDSQKEAIDGIILKNIVDDIDQEENSNSIVEEVRKYEDPPLDSLVQMIEEEKPIDLEENSSDKSSSHAESCSSYSLPPNAIRSSSSLHFFRSESSSTFWNDETSLLLDDQNTTKDDDQTICEAPTEPEIVTRPQVFRPMSIYVPEIDGPSRHQVIDTMKLYDIPSADNGTPFWGDANDYVSTTKTKDSRRVAVPIRSNLVRHLPEFGSNFQPMSEAIVNDISTPIILTTLAEPPSRGSVIQWLKEKKAQELQSTLLGPKPLKEPNKEVKKKDACDRSQLEAPSMNNSFGFRVSFGNCLEAKAVHQHQYVTVMSLELHIETRQHLRPDPEFDSVTAVFYTITNDVPVESQTPDSITGVIVVHSETGEKFFNRAGIVGVEFIPVENEMDLFQHLAVIVSQWNPDILVGYEIEMLSWGYLLQRSTILNLPFHNLVSRLPSSVPERLPMNSEDIIEGGYMVEKNSDINIPGRIVLNLWRILRVEIALQSYTFENMVFHILHRRVANYTFDKLSNWWTSNHNRLQVVEHYVTRVRGNIELMEQLDIIGRTSELARLFGIQFYEVFTRGSQYRVESMMLRLAKPKNFVASSPSVIQRSRMKAPEWLPLIMEPESRFYTDPVLVLDFQSLYPSMIIAYNYCYSTCLGRTHLIGKNEPFEFGCTQLLIPPAVAQYLVKQDLVNISPAGVVFVKPHIRRGIIPQMLSEILNTRIMVKQSMKEYEGDTTLRRVFDSRQLGLKLIANVTYGYTSANFSGRMPCVELGDSVVAKGRETLERAIHLIESRSEWKARVVYGDTDSVFVLLPGRSRQEAFAIGDEMADAVTRTNPQPVKLKFEKVYQPCILQTKKRYVGYKYETIRQKDPVYEAKGIETVRRDGCPAVVKLLERSLRVLFESCDVSKVKAYVQRQFSKILQNRSSLQDFIFAKEFRGRQGYKPGACVPALEITKQQMKIDRRNEPRIGERVPYIVIYGSPGVPLIRLVVPANQLLSDPSLRLNGHYYISRAIIPALQRCFGLLGVDVLSWYQSLPRASSSVVTMATTENGCSRKATISQYFGSSLCLLCDEPILTDGLCAGCGSNRQASSFTLASIQRLREKDYAELISLCRNCTGNAGHHCVSMDCPVLYRRVKAYQNLQLVSKWFDALSHL